MCVCVCSFFTLFLKPSVACSFAYRGSLPQSHVLQILKHKADKRQSKAPRFIFSRYYFYIEVVYYPFRIFPFCLAPNYLFYSFLQSYLACMSWSECVCGREVCVCVCSREERRLGACMSLSE